MTVAGQPTVNYTYDANSRLTQILTDVIAGRKWGQVLLLAFKNHMKKTLLATIHDSKQSPIQTEV